MCLAAHDTSGGRVMTHDSTAVTHSAYPAEATRFAASQPPRRTGVVRFDDGRPTDLSVISNAAVRGSCNRRCPYVIETTRVNL